MRALLIAAVLPALLLMLYIYKKDRLEKEPGRLLFILVVLGAVACLPASLFETVALRYLSGFTPMSTIQYAAIESFLIVGLAEEGCKHFFLRRRTWNSPEFNCTFDGIVYAVFVSLGFAALENVIYALSYGFDVLFQRAVFSIPGHTVNAVFMGLYYSRAKKDEAYGRFNECKKNRRLSLLVPVILHGFYDFCLLSESEFLGLVFFAFVVVLDIISLATVKRESERDMPITGWENY